MSRKPAKKLPVKVASRWKKKALKEEEEEARWAAVMGEKANKSKEMVQQVKLAQQQLQSIIHEAETGGKGTGAEECGSGGDISSHDGEKSDHESESESESESDCDENESDCDENDSVAMAKKRKRDGLRKKEKEKERLIKKRSRWSGRRRLKGKEIDKDEELRWKDIIRKKQNQDHAVPAHDSKAASCKVEHVSHQVGVSNDVKKSTKTINPALFQKLRKSSAGHSQLPKQRQRKESVNRKDDKQSANVAESSNNIFDVLSAGKKKKK
jgi:hypothetical protein